MKDKISVILPVFNMEKTLERAVESVRNQQYPDWELLIIDDGSTDGSGRIIREYAKKDSRIRGFRIPNGGVSNARNFGIEKAEGEWIAFLDGDDRYLPNAFSDLLREAGRADLIVGSFEIVSDRKFNVGELPDMCFRTTDLPAGPVMETLWQNFLFAVVWNRLYRRSRLRARFDISMDYGEDTTFNIQAFSDFERCAVMGTKTYVYTWPRNEVRERAIRGRLRILREIEAHFPDNEVMKRVSVYSMAKILRRYAAETLLYDFTPEESAERLGTCREYVRDPLIAAFEKYLPENCTLWWARLKAGEYRRVTEDYIREIQDRGKPLSYEFVKINERGKIADVLCGNGGPSGEGGEPL